MTKALREVFEAAAKLPAAEQESLAAAIKAELEADEKWEQLFASSQDALARLADEALAEYRSGRAQPFDPNES
jgi:hypothetical protein